MNASLSDRFVGSPTIDPRGSLEELLNLCSRSGLRHFEAMVGWADSALDLLGDPQVYRNAAKRFGMDFTSMHLPAVRHGDRASLDAACAATRFAAALGVETVIFKASDIAAYAEAAGPILDEAGVLGLQVVITNHAGSALSTIADVESVLDRLSDERLLVLLEVGHFHAAGERWQAALASFAPRIGLVHFKDVRGSEPVPYGQGEIDLDELFARLAEARYGGRLVIEMEGVAREEVEEKFADGVARIADAWLRSGGH